MSPTVVALVLFSHGLVFNAGIDFIVASGVTHAFYWYCLAKAYEGGDLSHVYPIMRSSPAPVLIFAILFLGEEVTLVGTIGILLVAIGVYIINVPKLSLSALKEPLTGLFKESHVRYAFLTLLGVTTYSLLDKSAMGYVHPLIFLYAVTLISQTIFSMIVISTKGLQAIKSEWSLSSREVIFNGILIVASYVPILVAFTMERVSYIVALRQISVVFAVILGGHLLKEDNRLIRLIASTIIFVGAFIIATAE